MQWGCSGRCTLHTRKKKKKKKTGTGGETERVQEEGEDDRPTGVTALVPNTLCVLSAGPLRRVRVAARHSCNVWGIPATCNVVTARSLGARCRRRNIGAIVRRGLGAISCNSRGTAPKTTELGWDVTSGYSEAGLFKIIFNNNISQSDFICLVMFWCIHSTNY